MTDRNDPHPERLANYIIEKMDPREDQWSAERLANRQGAEVHDRTSAHRAAWHSPKREAHHRGTRFKLDHSRVWMRLIFAAARETGLFDVPAFEDWFVRFIGHFIQVYERSARIFARESARWSANPANVATYMATGDQYASRTMHGVVGVSLQDARQDLTPQELRELAWPYQ